MFTDENKTRAGIAAMNCGTYQILSEVVIDYYTTNSDFSADVMSRAQFYSENLFWPWINDPKFEKIVFHVGFWEVEKPSYGSQIGNS